MLKELVLGTSLTLAPTFASAMDEAQQMMTSARIAAEVDYRPEVEARAISVIAYQDETKAKYWEWQVNCDDLVTKNRMGTTAVRVAHNRAYEYGENEEAQKFIDAVALSCPNQDLRVSLMP